jgi:DNA-directed RNA polymerase beta' subunit
LWIKGEYLDVLGMIDCLNGREIIIKAQMATEEKKRSEQKEFEKLSAGKTTLKSIFSSKAKKETSMQNLDKNQEVLEKEISDYKALGNYLTTYHAQEVIAKFKEEKYREYVRMLNNFCVKEISNAHTNATLYH